MRCTKVTNNKRIKSTKALECDIYVKIYIKYMPFLVKIAQWLALTKKESHSYNDTRQGQL